MVGWCGEVMLIYEKKEREGSLDVETLVYFSGKKDGVLNIAQGVYKGAEVVSHSSVTLTTLQYTNIVSIVSQIQIQNFLKDYKAK